MSKQDDGPDKKNEQPKDAPKTETTENDEIKKQENVESVNPEVQKSEENAENTPLADEQDTDNVNVEDGQPAPVEKPKRRFPRKALYICIVLVISVVIAGGVISVLIDRYGLGKTNKQIDITVPKGADTDTIASLLKKDGVIQYPFVFKIFYKRNHGKYNSFQSGSYSVNPSQGYEGIIEDLTDPSLNQNKATVTITEGQTIQQIAQTMEAKGVCSQKDFLNTLKTAKFDFPFASQIPNNQSRDYKYAGYLFPDTYTLLKNSSGKSAIQKMLTNFSGKFTPNMQAQAKADGMTVDQIVTLASIIQKEASDDTVMADVSSTFYNRLKTGINGKRLLQSDATVIFAKKNLTQSLTSSDAALSSPYNTYRSEGLTPGAICSPGIDAIRAALYPNKTNYFYFVSDANGKFYFAETFAQHQKNVETAKEAGATEGAGDLDTQQ